MRDNAVKIDYIEINKLFHNFFFMLQNEKLAFS